MEQTVQRSKTFMMALCGLFAAVTAICSWISIPLGFTPVPVNLGTLAVFLTGGLLGFVGLIVPHCVRRIVGNEMRFLLPFSALGGSLLVLSSDFLCRIAFAPYEVPVGIFLALIGGPFFFVLLIRGRRYGNGS